MLELMEPVSPVEVAILKTLLYGDVFDFPMTGAEIHHFLLEQEATPETIQRTLKNSAWLAQHVIPVNGYYALRPEAADLRHQREQISAALWDRALKYGVLMSYLPFVRMVAMTGALSMRNATSSSEDFDYMIVTRPGRVWLTRLLAVTLVRLARWWGVELCPNYVLSESMLLQQRQDMFTAHEVTQMIPVSGPEVYQKLRETNAWTDTYLPNAKGSFYPIPCRHPRGLGRRFQKLAEFILEGKLGDWLEAWEHQRKQRKFAAEEARSEHSAAEIDAERVKGHFQDYGYPVLRKFYARLQKYNLG